LSSLVAFVNGGDLKLAGVMSQRIDDGRDQGTCSFSVGDDDCDGSVDIDDDAGQAIAFAVTESKAGGLASEPGKGPSANRQRSQDPSLYQVRIDGLTWIERIGSDGQRGCAIIEPSCHKAVAVADIYDSARGQVRRGF
jgi:hypothetical protein